MNNGIIRRLIFRIKDLLISKTSGEQSWAYLGKCIQSKRPLMAARFGAVEIKATLYGKNPALFFPLKKYTFINMSRNAGFFPVSKQSIRHFSNLMLEDVKHVDILFSWRPEEFVLKKDLRNAYKASLSDTNIHPGNNAFWTKHLAGRKILVIHPFAATIEKQYNPSQAIMQGLRLGLTRLII